MNLNNLRFFIPQIILVAITVTMIFSYDHLPNKKFKLIPTNPYSVNGFSKFIGDKDDDGVVWDKDIDPYVFTCDLAEAAEYGFCGIIFNFNWGVDYTPHNWIDLSGYDSITLELEASANLTSVRLGFRSESEKYYVEGDYQTRMYINTMLNSDDLNKRISIKFDHLRIAEWWMTRYNIARIDSRPDFSRVVTLGADITFENPKDTIHKLRVKEFTFEGILISQANWYLLIVAMWVLFFFYQLICSVFRVRKQSIEDQKLLEQMGAAQRNLQEKNTEYRKDSFTDALTGVLNRRGFDKEAKNLNEKYEPGISHCIIFMDIDHFKRVNDTYGHDEGDKILKTFCELAQSVIDESGFFARWGGEEFVLICPNSSSIKGRAKAEKIRLITEAHEFGSALGIKVTCSFGIAMFGSDNSLESAIQQADKALYSAKTLGRNRVIFND